MHDNSQTIPIIYYWIAKTPERTLCSQPFLPIDAENPEGQKIRPGASRRPEGGMAGPTCNPPGCRVGLSQTWESSDVIDMGMTYIYIYALYIHIFVLYIHSIYIYIIYVYCIYSVYIDI